LSVESPRGFLGIATYSADAGEGQISHLAISDDAPAAVLNGEETFATCLIVGFSLCTHRAIL
jgi:hypothetical protein